MIEHRPGLGGSDLLPQTLGRGKGGRRDVHLYDVVDGRGVGSVEMGVGF